MAQTIRHHRNLHDVPQRAYVSHPDPEPQVDGDLGWIGVLLCLLSAAGVIACIGYFFR